MISHLSPEQHPPLSFSAFLLSFLGSTPPPTLASVSFFNSSCFLMLARA